MRADVPFFLVLAMSSLGLCQGKPLTVAPGLTITKGTLPVALDQYEGKPQLVPIHHSTVAVNNHVAANLVGAAAGSFFYKPKVTTELAGAHARTQLHTGSVVFYFFRDEEDDTRGDGKDSDTMEFALATAVPEKDRRVFARIRYTQLTGHAKREDGLIKTTVEALGDGWFRLTPTAPLAPGEYALTPVPKDPRTFSSVVFDFSLEPEAQRSFQ